MKPLMILALALLWSAGALAQEAATSEETTDKATAVPATIDFQGRLNDSGGSPVNATLSIKFSLYDIGSGGTALWTETKSVQVTNGLFQVKLGEVIPFTQTHFSGTDRWLGIQVGTEAEMSPRTKISSVGYAMQALETDPSWQGNANTSDAIGRTGKVGIGLTSPTALLHTRGIGTGEGNVVFVGQYTDTPGGPPLSGGGTRLMWYPDMAAFRVGFVYENQWDQGNIGKYSSAMGCTPTASGHSSTAFGYFTTASGSGSTAMGRETTASGSYSTAIGFNSSASGGYSTAMGYYTVASATVATAIGKYNVGGGNYDTWVATDPLFEIGNGTSSTERSNALTVLKNGNVGIGTHTPTALLHAHGTGTGEGNVVFVGESKGTTFGAPPVSGPGTRMMWYPDKSAFRAGEVNGNEWDEANIGFRSVAMGIRTTASGTASTALGGITTASGMQSTAIGYGTLASALNSTAMGANTVASGNGSTAMGSLTTASGRYSTATGVGTNASAYGATAIGSCNVGGGNASDWVSSDPLFEIGNGISTSARSNALTVLKNGFVGIGTATPAEDLVVSSSGETQVRLIRTSGTAHTQKITFWKGSTEKFAIGFDLWATGANLFTLYDTPNNYPVLNITNTNVGIGRIAPAYKLDVEGSIRANTTVYSSDRRLKTQILPVPYGLQSLMELQGVSYLWNSQDFPERNFEEGLQLGFIAQDLEQVIPELVSTDEEGFKSIDYVKIIPILVEGMKDLKAENDRLQAENDLLKQNDTQLNARLERLERALESLSDKWKIKN